MMETEMGYRGSKSEINIPQPNIISVKEQRVDGSYCIKKNFFIQLRCTLTGFERNYPVKIPSKQLNMISFSTLIYAEKIELNPRFFVFIIIFLDAESWFSIKIQPNAKLNSN